MEMMTAMYFPSNVLFMTLGDDGRKDEMMKDIVDRATNENLGVVLLKLHPKMAFGDKKMINFWVREKSPNINLAILIALQLEKNWNAGFRIIQVVKTTEGEEKAMSYLVHLKQLMRMPADTELVVKTADGGFQKALEEAPVSDINIFGMSDVFSPETIRETGERINTSTLFIKDSKLESAYA